MKKTILIFYLAAIAAVGFSQENQVIVSGGYAFANMEDLDAKLTGWRINGEYQFNPQEGNLSYGFVLGYASLKGASGAGDVDTADYKYSTLPLYFAPKYMIGIGGDDFKVFIKGALGTHNTNFKRTGSVLEVEGQDWGFYGGFSAGILYNISDLIFINAEYEFAWMSNSTYQDGLLNSVMGGIGFKF